MTNSKSSDKEKAKCKSNELGERDKALTSCCCRHDNLSDDALSSKNIQSDAKNIHDIDYGIAFTTGSGNIYINKDLKKYDKELYDRVLKHEQQHDLGAYNSNDLQQDLNVDLPFIDKLKFCMKYPRGFMFLSPVITTKDEVVVSTISVFEILTILCLIAFVVVYVRPW